MRVIPKADRLGHLTGSKVTGLDKVNGGFNATMDEIFVNRHAGLLYQKAVQMVGMIPKPIPQHLIGDLLMVMGTQILDQLINQRLTSIDAGIADGKPCNQGKIALQ